MIELSKVTKTYGRKNAVVNISIKAESGHVIGLLGPNGAGKTTTMRLILGYISPTVGTVNIEGINPLKKRVSALQKIGYLPENNPLYLDMKVGEYLDFIAKLKKELQVKRVLKMTGLENVVNQKIEELSRGYKQRVGLAAALCGDPKILILDEPTSGLDPIEQEKIQKLIHDLSKKKTVFFSTHILSEVEEIADTLIILYDGKIVYNGKKPSGKGAVEKLFKKVVKRS